MQEQTEACNGDGSEPGNEQPAPVPGLCHGNRRFVAVGTVAVRNLQDGGIAIQALDARVACGMGCAARNPAFEFFLPGKSFGILAHHEPGDRLFLDQVDVGAGWRHSGHRAGSTARAIAARAFIM
jgi:hypothetical protein